MDSDMKRCEIHGRSEVDVAFYDSWHMYGHCIRHHVTYSVLLIDVMI
jgi:hypothetical protein